MEFDIETAWDEVGDYMRTLDQMIDGDPPVMPAERRCSRCESKMVRLSDTFVYCQECNSRLVHEPIKRPSVETVTLLILHSFAKLPPDQQSSFLERLAIQVQYFKWEPIERRQPA